MKRSVLLFTLSVFAVGAFATSSQNHTCQGNATCGGTVNNTTNTTNGITGGTFGGSATVGNVAGGAGGAGGAVLNSGNSSVVNAVAGGSVSNAGNSKNDNTNVNTNVVSGGSVTIAKDAIKNTNENNNYQGQHQGQGQSQAIIGSGNSSIENGAVENNVQGSTQSQNISEGAVQNSNTVGGAEQSQSNENTVDSSNQGNSASTVNIDNHSVYQAAKIPRPAVNSAYAAPLTSSNDTCMGSSSAGITTYGISISAGSTWTDNNCVMLKNSRELWNMGARDAAIARMCMDDLNRDALEVTGIQCPDFKKVREDRKARQSN